MSRRKLKDKSIRKLTRTGGSIFVGIPKELMTELGWREKQKVVVKKRGDGLVIKDWPVRRSSKSVGGKK